VSNPRASAAELATSCGLSVSATGRALVRLADMGMVSQVPGRPVRYLAAAPDVAVGELIGQREAELSDVRGAVHRLMERYRAASRHTHPEQSIEVLIGRENISNRVGQMQQSARVQIRGFDKPPYLVPPGNNMGKERRQLRRGIRYRVIYDREAVSWPGRFEADILVGIREGEQARVRPELPVKMFMADDRMAIIPISSTADETSAAYLIHRSSLLDALATLFEAEWDRAVPIPGDGDAAPEDPDAPDSQTRDLLTLLAAGLTDNDIAKTLAWSPRTTQRRISQLMTELGATTRFQAGRIAQRRGWL
jgi:DNA-binding CsgD family transcriptional regulator